MLLNDKIKAKYVLSIDFDLRSLNIITTICKTNGVDFFDFQASFEICLENDTISLIKKIAKYEFTIKELEQLREQLESISIQSIQSIINETSFDINDISLISLNNLEISKSITMDLSKALYKQLNIPVIIDIKNSDEEYQNYLTMLNNQYDIKNSTVVDFSNTFNISKFEKTNSRLADTSLGFDFFEKVVSFYNLNTDTAIICANEGSVNDSLVSKLLNLDDEANKKNLQKTLFDVIIYSKLDKADAIKSCIEYLKRSLLIKVNSLKNYDNLMLIGNSYKINGITEELVDIFNNTIILENATERQTTLKSELFAFIAYKKHILKNYNNGIKIS